MKEYQSMWARVSETNRDAFESGKGLIVRPAYIHGFVLRNHMEWLASPDHRSWFRKVTDYLTGRCRREIVDLLIGWADHYGAGIVHQRVIVWVRVCDLKKWLEQLANPRQRDWTIK